MMTPPRQRPVIYVLLVTLLTSAVGWTFNAAAVTHDFGHEQRVHGFTMTHEDEFGLTQMNCCEDSAGIAAHLSLHAAEHAQLFFLGEPILVAAFWGSNVFIPFVSAFTPESVPGSLFRPPRNNFEI
jgi:hypothetical protein